MLESDINNALAANDVSLSLINEAANAHASRKQSLQDKINAIKNGKNAAKNNPQPQQKQTTQNQDNRIDAVEEYRDLMNKIDFGFKAPDKEEAGSYFMHRPPSIGLITADINKVSTGKDVKSAPLAINPNLAVLRYKDFEKIALAQKSEDITIDILRNHINGDNHLTQEFPEIQTAVNKLQNINKNNNEISYDTEEFNQIQALVLKNFNELYPDFKKNCQDLYEQNKDHTRPDIEISKYQRYCILSDIAFIPNIHKPDIIHDMESKEVLYDMAVNNLDREPQKQKKSAKNKTAAKTIQQEGQNIGKPKKKPQTFGNDIYNELVNQELQKRLQNQQ